MCDGSLFPVADGPVSTSRGSAVVFLLRRASHAKHEGKQQGTQSRRAGHVRTANLDYLCQRGLGLRQPEGHVHGAVHCYGRRQRGTGLLPLA